jgi:glycolate oxidase FAD binding subunit
MTNAIANQLQSLVNSDLELLELSNASSYWQKQISQAVINPISPIYLVFPETVEILAAVVKQAQQHQWRILICGNGSKLDWGGLAKDIQLVVSIQKCDRIIEHAVGDLTVTIEAGVKLADLQEKLRSHGQFLPIDPAYPQSATIGGIVATADTGSWRQRYGGIRDLLLGLSFVRADGEIAKAGGRVVKNVAGYDLMKLFTGAYGTLGIISQVTFRTYPLVATSQTIILTGKADDLAQATQTIRNSSLTPTAMDLLSASVIEQLELKAGIGLITRFQTIPQSIKQQLEQVQAIAQKLNLTVTDYQDSDETNLWHKLAAIIRIPGTDTAIICKIGIAPAAAAIFLQSKPVVASNSLAMIHAASGVGQIQLKSQDMSSIAEMRSLCQQNQGFLTILKAPQTVKQQLDVWGYTGNALKTMQTIKQKFDSKQILNPDRFAL